MAEYRQYLAILEVEPSNAQALAALERLAAQGDGFSDPGASRALDDARRIHRERGDLELVARLIDVEIAAVPDRGRRADLLLEKGKLLADEFLNEDAAIECFQRVLELRPDDEDAQEVLAHMGLVRENWEKIVKKYLDEARVSTDRQLTTSLYLSVAETYARYQRDAEEVEKFLRKALEVEPKNRRAAQHLERLLRQAGRWEDLATLLGQRVEAAATREERVQALLALADLARTRLGAPQVALDCMKKILAIEPAHPRALKVLVEAYSAEENWAGLVKLYEGALRSRGRTSPADEQALWLQIAMLYWKHLGNMDTAEEYFRRVRKADPAHEAMVEFYRQYHRDRGEGQKLLQVLQAAQKAAEDPARRAALAVEMASLAEKEVGNPEKAIDSWKAILRQDPRNQEARAALKRLYQRTEKWNALLELLKEEIEAIPIDAPGGKEQRVERLLEVVAIYRDRLNLDVMVINTYNTILALVPDHHGALDALAQKYEQLGRWNDLTTTLQRKADLPSVDRKTRIELYRRIASLWTDRFGNHAQAVKPLEELLAIEPADAEALARLKEIYTKRRQWRALLDLYGREAATMPPERRRAHLADMAALASDKLGDARLSIAIWNRLLEEDPTDALALASLASLYEREKRWLALAEVYHRQREAVGDEDPRAASAILERLGTLYAERLGAAAQAAAAFQEILTIQPGHTKALRVLRELHAQAGDLEALERLYGGLGAWDDLVEVLHGVAERTADNAQKLRVLERAAELAVEKLGAPEKAGRAYERILLLDPQHLEAARALVPIYRKGEKWARLLSTYEVLIGHATTREDRLALYREIRALCEEKIGSKAMAFQWTAAAFELAPDDTGLMKDLMRLGADADAWDRVAELLERRVDADEVAAAEKLRLLRELGRIRAQRLHRPDEARAAWERVLELEPDDPEAMAALEELATQQARWPDLLVIFRRRVELEEDPARKIEMLFKIAFIEEERVLDLEAAAKTYDRIVQLDPRSQRALRALSKVQGARGDAAGLARALELELQHATEPETRVSLLLRLGGLYEEKLSERRAALDRYQAALALQPTNKAIHAALERFMGTASEERVEVARLMAPIYERLDDPSRLSIALEILRSAEKDDAARLAFDRRLIAIYARRLKDPLNAYEVGTRILAAAPEDVENRRELVALAGELEAYDDLVNHLEKAVAAAQATGLEGAVVRELLAELADVYDDKLSSPGPAEAAWRRVLDLDPADARAYEALERILRGAERWDDLREILERHERHTLDAGRRKEILLQLCDLYEGVLESTSGATEAYRRVLELDPASMRALKALERLHDGAGAWAELEELLGREAEVVKDERTVTELLFRRAELRAARLSDPHGAVDLAEEVLRRDRTHAAARRLLEGLFASADHKLRIAKLLAPLYEEAGEWRALVGVLSGERELAGSPAEEVELLARIARLQEERLRDDHAAFATWAEAVREGPDHRAAREHLERLARRLDRWTDAAATWEDAIARVSAGDLSLKATLVAEVAAIYDRCLGDPAKATWAYRRLLDLDPGNVEVARPAAEALERLYEEQDAWPELIEILRRQSDWSDDPARRAASLERIATIQERKLGDVPAAIATWRELWGEDGEHERALDALERLHASRGEHRELVEILRRRTELAGDARVKRALLLRVAELMERELREPAEAVTAYLEVLDFLPEDRDVLSELARLYRAGERWADLLEIDERRLALAESPSERAQLRFELGEILRDRAGRADEALERFREILAEDATHAGAREEVARVLHDRSAGETLRLRAAEILEPIYAGLGDHRRLVELYQLQVDAIDDPRERIGKLRRIAQLREAQLGEPDAAFDALARATREAVAEPEFRELLAGLTRLAVERDRVADLVQLYRELAPEVLDAELQRQMYLDIADLARGKLHDPALAKDYYRRVVDANPDDPRALDALELLYRETQDHHALRDVLTRKADRHADDLDLRHDVLVEIAVLSEEKLDAVEEAIAAWEQVLELQPADVDATRALERLYAGRERWVDLAELLEKRLGFAEDLREAVELRFRLGELYEKQLTDPDRAVENYQAVLGGDPYHAGAIAALERYLEDAATRLQVAEVLEPIYIARQDWPRLIRIAEVRLDAEKDPQNRRQLTRRIARLHEEQLEDLEGAFRWYGKVFREDPDDRTVRDQLMRLAQILERWDALANVYQEFLDDEPGDVPATRDVARILADVYDRRLADVERARAAYRRVLQATPDDAHAFTALEAMLTRAARWFALIEAYEEAIEAALEPARRKDLYGRIARVQEARLLAPDKAIDAYRAVLEIDPDDEAAIAQLDRLYQEQKRWHDLSELYATRIERARTPVEANALRVRLAEVLETRLADVAGAIDQYEQALAEDPALMAAIGPLERLVLVEEHRQRIAAILEPIYRRHDWWQKLVVILDAQLEYIDDQARRVETLREIARLHETRGGAMELALRALARAWREDVAAEDVYADLERLAGKLGAWEELVVTLDGGVEGVYDYDLAARLLGRIGEIEETKRGRRPAAIAAWKRVLEVKEDDLGALDALVRLYAAERQFEPLVKVLERKVELVVDVVELKELLYRVADLYEQALGRKDAAIGAWKQILSLDDEDAAALDALERLHREQRDFRALVEILQRKIELAPDPAARRPLHFAAAKVQDAELHDAYEAIAQYRAILDANPNDAEALAALDSVLEREKMWADLVEVLDRRVELEVDPARRADLAYRAARVVEKEQSEPEQAIERYRRILEATPRHAATRAALEELLREEDTLESAAAALEPVYRAECLHDQVAELYERRLAGRGADPAQRKAWYATLAETHEVGRRDPRAAFAVWARCLREDQEDEATERQLERLAEARGAWAELAALYDEVLRNTMDGQLGRHYALKLATIYEEALGDLERAAARYRQALEQGGDEMTPLAALDRIFEREGKWAELAEVLDREAQAAMSAEDQASFLYRLGDVRERALGDLAGAVAAYRDVLERVPAHAAGRAALERLLASPNERAQVIAILEPIYEGEGDHARLADLLAAKLTVEADGTERASILSRIAELAEKRLGDKVRALDAVGGWLAEDPASELAAAELERLAGELGRWEEAAARLTDVIAASKGDVVRDLSLRLGRILLDELRDPARAEPAYRRALELEASHEGALGALDRIYRALGDAARLVDVLWRRADVEADARKKRDALAEAGRLAEERLGDDAGAVRAWKQVMDLEEGDAEAHARLAAIYERGGRWEELVEILETSARFAADRTAERALKQRVAVVLAERLGSLDRAVDAWHAVLDVEEDDAALVALADVHRRRQDWLAVQEALVRRLNLAAHARDKVAILGELVRLAEVERASADEAIGYLLQIIDLDNAHADAYAALERLYGATERYHELVELYARHADVRGTLGDTEGEIGLLARAAEVWEEKIGNADAAAELLEKILKREPRYVPALVRLARIYEAASEWEKCEKTLERALALGPSGRDAADLYFRLGRVAEAQTGDRDKALGYYQQALSYDGAHPLALEALEAAARERGDWVAVAGMLGRREAMEPDAARKLQLALELAEIYRGRLGQAEAALPYLERAAQLAPDDVKVADALADLYLLAGRAAEAEPLLARLLEKARAARRTKDVARYQQRLGVLREATGDAAGALAAYEEAYRLDPTAGATMVGLGRIYFAQAEWEKARRVYRSMLLQNLDPSVGVTKADVYLQLGLIHERLGEAPKAKSMYEKGLELDPRHEGLRQAMARLG